MANPLVSDALAIWHAGVDAVRPHELLRAYFAVHPEVVQRIATAPRIVVVGGGKAGAAMAHAVETLLVAHLDRIEGIINVPESSVRPLKKIRLHAARPSASNHPTREGVIGTETMLQLIASCGKDDVALVLLSGGGSALLPAPATEITLEDKQATTKLLHASGATIEEMNCVRKHLSRVKGGGLAREFRGKAMISLIISDVVGDPLDVIASGPTASDPSRFADALMVLDRYSLTDRVPPAVVDRLKEGASGRVPETLKTLPKFVENCILGSNFLALASASRMAESRGYRVLNLGSFIEGETLEVARVMAGMVRSIQQDSIPLSAPCCLLIGGETTVTLGSSPGKGGRNQEFTLAMLHHLGEARMKNICVLSGGTDGEDGPTDAAGAWADATTFETAKKRGLNPEESLRRHDAYPFFDGVGSLIRTGLTETNVMDLRVVLCGRK